MPEKKEHILLDAKIVKEFQKQAKETPEYPLDYGEMALLRRKLMEVCGVTEVEALNILCGRNVRDYISKYEGQAAGRVVLAKEYEGDVQVVYKITEDEKELFA